MSELLFAIVSVLTVWALLGVLAVGLLLVLKALQSIRAWFERITAGVRAVEHQTAPLTAHATAVGASLDDAAAAVRSAAGALREAESKFARQRS